MDSIADFFSKDDEIEKLKKRISAYRLKAQVQRTQKDKAIIARKNEIAKRIRTCNVLIDLVASGKLCITVKEIAGLCFISEKSVWQAKAKLKKSRNKK
jgi:DNA-binding CsgD family transcriptional regulator